MEQRVQSILESAKPTLVNGRWRKPVLSRRRLGELARLDSTIGEAVQQAAAAAAASAKLDMRGPKKHVHERASSIRKREEMIERKKAQIPKAVRDWEKARDKSEKDPRGIELLMRHRNPKTIRWMRSMLKSVKDESASDSPPS